MQVGARSRHASFGAAAVACMRSGKSVCMRAVGADACATAAMASAHAAFYLAREGLAVIVAPASQQLDDAAVCLQLAMAAS